MIQKVLSHYHLSALSCVGLVLFMIVFIAALLWVFRRGSAKVYSDLRLLPLQDLNPTMELKGKLSGGFNHGN